MIKIIADTTCGLPLQELYARGIDVMPQYVTFGDKVYRDDTELDTATFLKLLGESSKLPGTAAPHPALYQTLFEKYAKEGHTMIIITPSIKVSGTFRGASTAKMEFPEADIRVIDSKTIAGGLGMMVLRADDMAKAGASADEIVAEIDSMIERHVIYFVVDTLEYLHKGGRIGGAAALIGGVLQIKPILTFEDGGVVTFEKERTQKRALARLRELVFKDCPEGGESFLTCNHCGAPELCDSLAVEFETALHINKIPRLLVPASIVVHGGPGIVAISFFKKKQ